MEKNYRGRKHLVQASIRLWLCLGIVQNSCLASRADEPSPSAFKTLCDQYVSFVFKHSPTRATESGMHDYDCEIEDLSSDAIKKSINDYQGFLKTFVAIKIKSLSVQDRVDLQLMLNDTTANLLELQEIRMWEKDPDLYSSLASSTIYTLMKRNFADPKVRLKDVIEREKKLPALLEAARKNLRHPPKIYTEIALEQLPEIITFFKRDVPSAFNKVKDSKLNKEFQEQNNNVIAQLSSYQAFLEKDLLPNSDGQFAIGLDLFQSKLFHEEFVLTPVNQLLKQGEAELHRLQEEFRATARKIDPNKSEREVYLECSKDHPDAKDLISSVSNLLASIKTFCTDHAIVSFPNEEKLSVAETPPFMRATTFASMDSPGPFEKNARNAFYYVTLPESSWSKERAEEHMRFFCKYDLMNTSVHEAYPGHFVQFLFDKNLPSDVRKIFGCGTNVEGWAHYCEQMMYDEGYGGFDERYHLIQLHDALLRACRFVVGIKLHTKGMTVDEAVQFFMKEGYMEKANAERESKRGTKDPTYLVYTLGKLEILRLRNDYKAKKGNDYTLQKFHDAYLSAGAAPLPLVRLLLLGP